jgi:hypothetical protein
MRTVQRPQISFEPGSVWWDNRRDADTWVCPIQVRTSAPYTEFVCDIRAHESAAVAKERAVHLCSVLNAGAKRLGVAALAGLVRAFYGPSATEGVLDTMIETRPNNRAALVHPIVRSA